MQHCLNHSDPSNNSRSVELQVEVCKMVAWPRRDDCHSLINSQNITTTKGRVRSSMRSITHYGANQGSAAMHEHACLLLRFCTSHCPSLPGHTDPSQLPHLSTAATRVLLLLLLPGPAAAALLLHCS